MVKRNFLLLALCLVCWVGFPKVVLADSTGAWQIKHQWQDPMANGADGKTYADGYADFAAKRARELLGVRLDCADMSIAMMVEYAYKHGLEVTFWFPAEKKTVSSKDSRFKKRGFKGFLKWAKNWVGAQNLADNTYALPIDDSKAGDVVLFDWGQTPEWPNFPGRVVWHTYVIGSAGAKVIYYGNEGSNNEPLPVTIAGESTQDRIRHHPDRYGSGARRWNFFKKKPTAPSTTEVAELKKEGKINASALNIRKGPGTKFKALTQLKKDAPVKITGKHKGWLRLDLGNGKTGWAYGKYITITPGTAGVLDRMGHLERTATSPSNQPENRPENR